MVEQREMMEQTREKKEKVVYFYVKKSNKHRVEGDPSPKKYGTAEYIWYAIDDNDSPVDPHFLAPVFESRSDSVTPYRMCGFASWKSLIFILGGYDDNNNCISNYTPVPNVSYIDTRRPQLGWKRGPDLLTIRERPYSVVINGEIWVLGGSPDPSLFAESLQPQPLSLSLSFSSGNNNNSSWSLIDMGPDDDGLMNKIYYSSGYSSGYGMIICNGRKDAPGMIVGHAIYSNKLFVYGSDPTGSLYCYDISAKKWSVVAATEDQFHDWGYHQCASIGEIMCFVSGDIFMGFDLTTHEWYKGVGLDKDSMLPYPNDPYCESSYLLHIGNETLCLIWCSHASQGSTTTIHCTKFGVSKEYDNTERCFIVKATVKSFKVYRVPGGYLYNCIAVDTGEESDDENIENQGESAQDQGTSVIITREQEERSAKEKGKLPKENKRMRYSQDY